MMNNMMMKLIKVWGEWYRLVLFDSLVAERLGKSRYKNPTIPIEKHTRRVDNRLGRI